MTKRALSLLLTLVMVLSLCVPALAAEDFEAEAPAEVVEEAPEAPEAPVAPEAEEPADEPVADEPAAEEPVEEAVAEDAPEMASVLPEDTEDLPYLVALGVVDKYSHYKLEKALKTAAAYKTKVDNDELYVKASYTDINQDDSPAQAFLDAYAVAQKNLDGINGVVVNIDVTDASVLAAAHELTCYFSEEDGGKGWLVSDLKLTSTSGKNDIMDEDDLFKGLKVFKTYDGVTPQYEQASTYRSLTATSKSKFDTEEWTIAYKSEYLNALKTAQEAIATFVKVGRSAEYKDFATARKAVLAAAKLEKAATVPTSGDADALKAAINKAKAVKDTYDLPKNQGLYAQYTANLFAANGIYDRANSLLSDTLGLNGLDSYVKYEDVQLAIRDLNNALTLKKNTFKVESYKLADPDKFEITVSIAKIGDNPANDGYDYGYALKIGSLWLDINNTRKGLKTAFDKNYIRNIGPAVGTATNSTYKWKDGGEDYPGRLVTTITFPHFTDKTIEGNFGEKETVTIYFYVKNVKKNDGSGAYTYSNSIANQTLSIGTNTWFGPTIKDAWVSNYNDGDITATNLSQLDSTHLDSAVGRVIEVAVTMSESFQTWVTNHTGRDFMLTVKNASGKNELLDIYNSWRADGKNLYTLTDLKASGDGGRDDTYIVAGTATAAIVEKVKDTDDTSDGNHYGEVTRTSMAFTINPLSKWKAVKNINKILAKAKALVQSDYNALDGFDEDLGCIPGRPDITSVQAAFQTINNDVKLIEDLINNSSVANTQYNRNVVIAKLKDLGTVYGYLAYKPITVEELNALIAECRPITEDEYTYDSWGVFEDARKAADKALTKNPVLQSDIDKAYADLLAAKNGLTKEGAVNKTALKDAIASAKALVEADYTPESWAANKDAIDAAIEAAQAVVDNANATQAQVNTALNTLTAAVAKLEKVATPEEGPKAPTSNNGTGWVLYDGTWYFFKNGKMVQNYWVGKIDGASQWDSNWYYVGADGKMATGMQYIDDLHGGYGWYFLQPTNTKGEIGKMLTGWQWVGGDYGQCYFSKVNGSSGKCTWSEKHGNWLGTGWEK